MICKFDKLKKDKIIWWKMQLNPSNEAIVLFNVFTTSLLLLLITNNYSMKHPNMQTWKRSPIRWGGFTWFSSWSVEGNTSWSSNDQSCNSSFRYQETKAICILKLQGYTPYPFISSYFKIQTWINVMFLWCSLRRFHT